MNIDWNHGELPPIGMRCQYRSLKSGRNQPFKEVEILFHYTPNSLPVAVFVPVDGERLVGQGVAECFRPIPTEDQLSAEKARNSGISQMADDAGVFSGSMDSLLDSPFAVLWDAGYRKQVAK